MPELKHYTVAQVRNWLEHNIAADGLTSEVIRPASAWAIIHNPFVKDEDPIIAAIYDNGVLAASTCACPEILEQPIVTDEKGNPKRIWWFPMLWVKPEFRGLAYGLIAIGSLAEIYGEDYSWTAWAVPEAIEIFEHLGLKTHYFPRVFMGEKDILTYSLRGKVAYKCQQMMKWWYNRRKPTLPSYDYSLRYLNCVDDESYEFICQHRAKHFIHSSQAYINWEVQYSWNISAPLAERVPQDGAFFAERTHLQIFSWVQVWMHDALIGVYRLRRNESGLTCDYIYYCDEHADIVYASVVEHLKKINASHFDTEDEDLALFVQQYIYFPKCRTEQLSLSISPNIDYPEHLKR